MCKVPGAYRNNFRKVGIKESKLSETNKNNLGIKDYCLQKQEQDLNVVETVSLIINDDIFINIFFLHFQEDDNHCTCGRQVILRSILIICLITIDLSYFYSNVVKGIKI